MAIFGPSWLAGAAAVVSCSLLWAEQRGVQAWQLRWVPGSEGGWEYRTVQDDWQRTRLHCRYLGPWLIGLEVAGRVRWIWPDSAPALQRQALRRVLVWASPQG